MPGSATMGLEPITFAAIYVSRKPLYTGKRILFNRELFGFDCRFRFYPAGGRLTLRILKDNPILKDLNPSTVYHFQNVNGAGFRRMEGAVTDLKTTKIYQLVKV
jgi:hypothetical protein